MECFLNFDISMKVKNDHRSKFSNSSNWKEEAWKKNQGFNEIRSHDLRDIISGCRRVVLHCALKFAKKKRNEAKQYFVYFAKR